MSERKTRSLTLSSDPVARLRELHELDNPSLPFPDGNEAVQQYGSVETPKHDNAPTPQAANAAAQIHTGLATQEPGREETRQHAGAEVQEPGNTAAYQRSRAVIRKRSNAALQPQSPLAEGNPVHQAMRQALMQPYSADLQKGPSTATTIRIPTEVWERLDMASSLLEQTRHDFHHKQDIISEALKEYLARIGRGDV